MGTACAVRGSGLRGDLGLDLVLEGLDHQTALDGGGADPHALDLAVDEDAQLLEVGLERALGAALDLVAPRRLRDGRPFGPWSSRIRSSCR